MSNKLNQDEIDIIGEVGNISMSQAATTLSALLDREVKITTPEVVQTTLKEILSTSDASKVVTSIDFKEGLEGKNLLMIDVSDAVVIADLMMGNDGEKAAGKELGEMELSAVGEAMNQMMGTAATAMSTMFKRKVDIQPPLIEVLKVEDNTRSIDIGDERPIISVSFDLQVQGIINSRISQIFTEDMVRKINDIMLSDKAIILKDRVAPYMKEEVEVTESSAEKDTLETEETKVQVQRPAFQELTDAGSTEVPRNLDLIMDIPLELTIVLGKSKRTIKDILSLGTGSVVELDKMTNEPLEILINGKLVAEGEVVVISESFGIRITNILSKEERVKHISSQA